MKAQRIASGLLLAGAVIFAAGYRDILGDECSGTGVGSAECPKDPGSGYVVLCQQMGVTKDDCPTKYEWDKVVGPFICIPPENPPLPTECGIAGEMTPLGWQPLLRKCADKTRCYWNSKNSICLRDDGSKSEIEDYYKQDICPQIKQQQQ